MPQPQPVKRPPEALLKLRDHAKQVVELVDSSPLSANVSTRRNHQTATGLIRGIIQLAGETLHPSWQTENLKAFPFLRRHFIVIDECMREENYSDNVDLRFRDHYKQARNLLRSFALCHLVLACRGASDTGTDNDVFVMDLRSAAKVLKKYDLATVFGKRHGITATMNEFNKLDHHELARRCKHINETYALQLRLRGPEKIGNAFHIPYGVPLEELEPFERSFAKWSARNKIVGRAYRAFWEPFEYERKCSEEIMRYPKSSYDNNDNLRRHLQRGHPMPAPPLDAIRHLGTCIDIANQSSSSVPSGPPSSASNIAQRRISQDFQAVPARPNRSRPRSGTRSRPQSTVPEARPQQRFWRKFIPRPPAGLPVRRTGLRGWLSWKR